MAEAPETKSLSRRSFGKRALFATAAAVAAPLSGVTSAQGTDEAFEHTHGLSEESIARMHARYENVLREYGSRLDDAQKKHVRAILVENERMLAPVLSFKLENGDPPADVLKFPEAAHDGGPDAV